MIYIKDDIHFDPQKPLHQQSEAFLSYYETIIALEPMVIWEQEYDEGKGVLRKRAKEKIYNNGEVELKKIPQYRDPVISKGFMALSGPDKIVLTVL